uniref:Uncharacterized protein n=1 Tax=viral metagenome TaxID=1070528 RepID=A0A6M3XZT4_9ZZZZ
MRIFVTGFHRAGSKSIAEHMAWKNNLPWVEEHEIDLWDFRRVKALVNCHIFDPKTNQFVYKPMLEGGFVLQCPFLAHKVKDLVWYCDKVYWADRNEIDMITSMKNGNFEGTALFIIKQFHDEFPNDPYWKSETFTNDEYIEKYFLLNSGDKYPQLEKDSWIRYYKLVVDVKKYFFETKFKRFCESVRLEDLPIYDSTKHLSGKKPLQGWELDEIKQSQNNQEVLWR